MGSEKSDLKQSYGLSLDVEFLEKLDAMAEADQRNRSAEVRFLIQQEWTRRQGQAKAEAKSD